MRLFSALIQLAGTKRGQPPSTGGPVGLQALTLLCFTENRGRCPGILRQGPQVGGVSLTSSAHLDPKCIMGLECGLVCGIHSEWPLPLRMQRRPFHSSTGSLNVGSCQLRDRTNVAVFTDTRLSEVCVYKLL